MPRVAILGVYKDGPESADNEVVSGKWSAWRLSTSSPKKLWKEAEAAIDAVIRRYGYINVYVYYGEGAAIPYVLRVDEIVINDKPSPAPGPALGPKQNSHVWIRYVGVERLAKEIPRDDFREIDVIKGQFSEVSRPLGDSAWMKMRHSGFVFVEDPDQYQEVRNDRGRLSWL
jgi:hypothetical protein